MRHEACLLATILVLSPGSGHSAAERPHSPNIVIILADDLGFGDVRSFNPYGRIPTPHIDRLSREGMRFTDAHSPSAVCTPTRYGLLTGRYAWRTRLKSGVVGRGRAAD
jgi:arylsulfatase A-like enzyme